MTYTAYDRPFMIEGEVNDKTIFFILDDVPAMMAFFSSAIIRKKKKKKKNWLLAWLRNEGA